MRTGAPAGRRGYFHQTALYGSDDEFLSIVVPFLDGALEAGEPAVVALGEATEQLVRRAVSDASSVSFVDGEAQHLGPASTIKAYRKLFVEHVARGAQQIRVVGEVPHPGVGAPWEWWARYEAAVNHAYDEFPVWGVCPYDTRSTPPEVLTDVMRTHPHLASGDGRHIANAGFEDPREFLSNRPAAEADPLEAAPPILDLVEPSPAGARRAVRDASRVSRLGGPDIADFGYAVCEVVTNALCHGRPPVRLRLWSSPDRMVAAVTDQGPGPTDPFAGLLPTSDRSSGGLGLWLAHQFCSHLTLGRDGQGFTVHLVTGEPGLPQ